jgi:hypothetical protein
MPDGSSVYKNFGGTPGVTVDMAGSAEVIDAISKAKKGGRPTFIQGRGQFGRAAKAFTLALENVSEGAALVVKGRSDSGFLFPTDANGNTFRQVPRQGAKLIDLDAWWANLEEGTIAGPAHNISFSSTSHSVTFYGPNGAKLGLMEITGMSGNATVMKNRVSTIILGTVIVRMFPGFEYPAQPMKTCWDVRSMPTVDGAQPKNWEYTVDMVLGTSGGEISIRQNSVALRSANFATPLSCLTESEELVVLSSTRPAVMQVSRDQTTASASIEAGLFLRDILRDTPTSQQGSTRRSNRKVGRNSPCPCGSGIKYKRCCGRPV